MDQSDEKRRHPRLPFQVPLDYITAHGTGRHLCRNISRGGLLFETGEFESPLNVGEEILINIPSKDREKLVKLVGEVIRVGVQGVGVKFKKRFDI